MKKNSNIAKKELRYQTAHLVGRDNQEQAKEALTHVGELLAGHHLVEDHQSVLGRQQPPQVLVLPPPALLVRDLLHCNQKCL